MQPPHGSGGGGKRMVVLNKNHIDTLRSQFPLAIAFREKPPVVAKAIGGYDFHTGKSGIFDDNGDASLFGLLK